MKKPLTAKKPIIPKVKKVKPTPDTVAAAPEPVAVAVKPKDKSWFNRWWGN